MGEPRCHQQRLHIYTATAAAAPEASLDAVSNGSTSTSMRQTLRVKLMSQRSCSGSIYYTNYALVDTDEVSDATPTMCWLISMSQATLHR